MPDANPLLQTWDLAPWSAIRAEHLVPAIEKILADNRQALGEIISTQSVLPTWDDLVVAVNETDARLDEAMSVIDTLSRVKHDDGAWLRARAACGEAANRYRVEKMSSRSLFRAYQRLAHIAIAQNFDNARKASLDKTLRRFRLFGAELSLEQQQELARLNLDISLLESLFLHRLDNASAAWNKYLDDDARLEGLSEACKQQLAFNARLVGHDGWLIPLNQKTFRWIMTDAEDRGLRQEYFMAYTTRASDQAPDAGQFDNGPVLEWLLERRHQKARLLGHDSFAQLSLANRIANSTGQVRRFLRRQVALQMPRLEKDARALEALAAELGMDEVQPWDQAYLAEKLRKRYFAAAPENLPAYFPLNGTLRRLCQFSERMFGARIVELKTFDRWHDGVRLFEVSERDQVIGHFYLDAFHYPQTPDVARTATLRNRRVGAEGQVTLPIAILYANFAAAADGQPCLLAHQDLRVLFHEFGHCLQHVLTQTPHYNLSGICGFAPDTAGFAGQFFERWCLSPAFLLWLAAHHRTGERLTGAQVSSALIAIQAQGSWQGARLLLNAVFDFELHSRPGDGRSVHQVFEDVQREIPQLKLPTRWCLANGLDGMATGYEASMYACKWSDVLACEAFRRFEEDWVFNPRTGREFRETVFAPADSRSLLTSVALFVQRPLSVDHFPAREALAVEREAY